MEKTCPFCVPDLAVAGFEGLVLALRDGYPVSPGHSLIVPRRHVGSFGEAGLEEQSAMLAMLRRVKVLLKADHWSAGANDRSARRPGGSSISCSMFSGFLTKASLSRRTSSRCSSRWWSWRSSAATTRARHSSWICIPSRRSSSSSTGLTPLPTARQTARLPYSFKKWRQAAIVARVAEVRGRFGTLARAKSDRSWRASSQIAQIVKGMPLWKLQTLRRQNVPFLYERSSGPRITLLRALPSTCGDSAR